MILEIDVFVMATLSLLCVYVNVVVCILSTEDMALYYYKRNIPGNKDLPLSS